VRLAVAGPEVVWSAVAAGDLERIASYLASESAVRAATIIDRIVDRTESLASLPMERVLKG